MTPTDQAATADRLVETAQEISGLLDEALRRGIDTVDGADMLIDAVNAAAFLALVGKRLVVANPVGAFAASRAWGSR